MRHLLYVIMLAVATACSCSGSHVDRGLEEAATMLHTDPTAAMDRLNRYDISAFKDSATMARWALLYSEALVVNRIAAPTDTIVDIAIDYYRSHNYADELRHASRLKALLKSQGSQDDELAKALYLQKEREFMLYKERMHRELTVWISLTILLIAAVIIVWQRQRIRLKNTQNEALIAEASALMSGMAHSEARCSDLQAKLSDILSNRFDIIDQLCDTYFESQGTRTERRAIAERVKSQIEEIRSDSGLFAEMEKCVNDCRSSLLYRLREAWPSIRPDDYRLTVYLACNLSNRSIAALMAESIDVVYKRKSRLKGRLSKLASPYAAQFMQIFK